MKLIKTNQIEPSQLSSLSFDLFIVASGYESRARHFTEKSKIKSSKNVCICFSEYEKDIVRISNDHFFLSNKFVFIKSSGNSSVEIENLLDELLLNSKSEINILVDYSCMTRIWYGAIIKYFKYSQNFNTLLNIYFVYSSSNYVPPPKVSPYNKYVGPIDGFYSLSIPSIPLALVIGLGYIQERAFGLSEFFDIQPLIFIADSSSSKDYCEEVINRNKELLSGINEENIFYYPLNNLRFSETLLSQICKDLLENYRVILAPCGPKPFTLLCFITSLRFANIDVWRISAGESETPIDKTPNGNVSCLLVQFNND